MPLISLAREDLWVDLDKVVIFSGHGVDGEEDDKLLLWSWRCLVIGWQEHMGSGSGSGSKSMIAVEKQCMCVNTAVRRSLGNWIQEILELWRFGWLFQTLCLARAASSR